MISEFYKGKRVFITGHTGFKGSWLSLWLGKMGAIVKGYALEVPEESLFHICSVGQGMNSVIGDIRNYEQLKAELVEFEPEIIFHLAAQPLVSESYLNAMGTYQTNVVGVINLFEIARGLKTLKCIVNVTTDKCYENKNVYWGYRESDPLGGYDPYSCSKACSELITGSYINSFFNPSQYSEHGVAVATARSGNVIGGGDFAKDRIVVDTIKAVVAGQEVVLRSPEAVRPWQYVLDSLMGYMILAKKLFLEGPSYNGAWNFGPSEANEVSVLQLVHEMHNACGVDEKIVIDGQNKFHETTYLRLDSYKARRELGHSSLWSFDKVVANTCDWYLNYYHDKTQMYEYSIAQITAYEHAYDQSKMER